MPHRRLIVRVEVVTCSPFCCAGRPCATSACPLSAGQESCTEDCLYFQRSMLKASGGHTVVCDAVRAVEHRSAFTAGAPPSSKRDIVVLKERVGGPIHSVMCGDSEVRRSAFRRRGARASEGGYKAASARCQACAPPSLCCLRFRAMLVRSRVARGRADPY